MKPGFLVPFHGVGLGLNGSPTKPEFLVLFHQAGLGLNNNSRTSGFLVPFHWTWLSLNNSSNVSLSNKASHVLQPGQKILSVCVFMPQQMATINNIKMHIIFVDYRNYSYMFK